jgi:hypothetical protein
MSGIKFRPAQGFASGDGQAFALTFSDIQAIAGPSGSPTPAAARLSSLVLPVDGGSNGLGPAFAVSGFAFTTEAARGYYVRGGNGQTSVGQFPPRTDREFAALVVAGGNRIGPTSRGHSS